MMVKLGYLTAVLVNLVCMSVLCEKSSEDAKQPQIIILSELSPPYTYIDEQGEFRGTNVDTVRQIFEKADISYEMKFSPWKRALAEIKKSTNTVIYPLSRIPEREKHFQWIAPLLTEQYLIYGVTGDFDPDNVDISSGDYSFVCPDQTILCIALESYNVPPDAITVISGIDDRQMIKMLIRGRVNFIVISEVRLQRQLEYMNIKENQLTHLNNYKYTVDEYLASSSRFDILLFNKLRMAAKNLDSQ